MKQTCRYHPTRAAHWVCDTCGITVCSECVLVRKQEFALKTETLHLCPTCRMPARWLGVENIIDPFWQRLPRFFLYPLNRWPLILMLALSAAATVFSGPGLPTWMMRIVLWGVTIKYSYAALTATASGDLKPPGLNTRTLSNDFHQVFKQIILFTVIGIGFGLAIAGGGRLLGTLFFLVATLMVPAMIILLATTNSLIQALNPVLFTRLAIRIGWSYLLLYFFLSLLGGAPTILVRYIIQYLPPPLHIFLFSLAKAYYTIISYHLMGYVILQYHHQIGYQVEYEDFRDPDAQGLPEEMDENGLLLNRVNLLIKEGRHDEALDVLKAAAGINGLADVALSERYYSLLKIKKREGLLKKHRPSHLDLLVGAGKKPEALQLYNECLADDSTFSPPAKTLFNLGSWLNETGKSKAAITTFNHLVKAHPDDPLVPKAYFRAAQIFNDRLMNPARARKILQGLVNKYPHHDIAPRAETYLSHLARTTPA